MTISKQAHIHRSVTIGPYSIIEDDVKIGARTIIGSQVVIRRGSRIGRDNRIGTGAQIGIDPQDYHYQGEPSWCLIGDRNVIREYVTISRATGRGERTIIGNDNFIMTYVHVAHNDIIGHGTVIASAVQLGGYVEVQDHAVVGGLSGVHQRCRIGAYAMLGAKSYLNKDLAPYLLARGNRACIVGVNVRGLRNQGFSWRRIEGIKLFYEVVRTQPSDRFRSPSARPKGSPGPDRRAILDFIRSSRRGILLPRVDPGHKKSR